MSAHFRRFIEEVRNATDLVEVIGADVELRPVGSVLKGLSPFNRESSPSFVVWPQTQSWHDFSGGGGVGGDVFTYLQQRDRLSFKQALFEQAARVGIPNPFAAQEDDAAVERESERRSIEELFATAAAYYHRALPVEQRSSRLRDHYGFTYETIDMLQLGWADGGLYAHFTCELGVGHELALKTGLFVLAPGGVIKDFFRNRLVFPYWKRRRVVYFIARATEHTEAVPWEQAKYKKLLTHSPKHPYVSEVVGNDYFYNEDAAMGAHELLITEGVTDCISAMQAGIACISPVTTRFRAQDHAKLAELSRCAKRIIICNDNEQSGAGAAGALQTAEALHRQGRDVRIAVLPRPEGAHKIDVNEYLRSSGAEQLRQVLAGARRYVEHLIAAIPADTAKADLEPLLAPVLRALAEASPIAKEAYIDALVARFSLGRRALQAMLKGADRDEGPQRDREHQEGEQLPAKVSSHVDGAPVSDDHIVPRGWRVADAAERDVPCIFRVVESRDGQVAHAPVCARPVVVTACVKNLTTGNEMLELGWKVSGGWRRTTIEREKAFDAAKIVEALAGRGFPVASSNRADMVAYLASYESANIEALPVRTVAEQMGWVSGGLDTFLCGSDLITADVITAAQEPSITFRAVDDGEAQLAEALSTRGTMDGWTHAVRGLSAYPSVMIGLYASFAAPLLEILRLPGFAIDWSHRTSSGKTAVLRAAASVWGNPDERDASSLVRTWKVTLAGFERLAAALKNLPVILDDTKSASCPSLVADVLYLAAAGHGKTRGSLRGSRRAATWRTILLSTGERKATDFTKDAGSVVRCLALWGSPFGGHSESIAILIRDVEQRLRDNYGHAGRQFVRWLMRQDANELRSRFAGVQGRMWQILKAHCDPAVASRMGSPVAVVELAGELVHEAMQLEWDYCSPWKPLLGVVTDSVRDVDRALDALHAAYDWALARVDHFHGRRERAMPPERWAGVWKDGHYLAFTGLTLRELLEAAGFEFDPIIKQWHERGWLLTDGGQRRRRTKAIKVDGVKGDYYALCSDALHIAVGGGEIAPL